MQNIVRSVVGAFLLIATTATVSLAQDYPKATGYVNDFTQLLSQEQAQQLSGELKDFDTKTTNEIAVVTVPSLQGYTVETYTLGLAKAWGVGKKEKNNGVVLLVAPNERKVRIEVGRGLEGVLSKAVVDQIVQNDILSQFRAGHMDAGIIAGAHAIVQRLQSRAVAAPVAQPTSTSSDNDDTETIIFFVVMSSVISAALLIGIVVSLINKARLRTKSADLLQTLPQKIGEARKAVQHPEVTQKTKDLLERAVERFAGAEAAASPSSGKIDWSEIHRELDTVSFALDRVLENVEDDKKRAAKARTEGPKLLETLPQILKDAEAKVGDSKKRRAALDMAWDQYNQAQAAHNDSGPNLINWLLIYELLTSASSNANTAVSTSHSSSSDSYSGSSGSYGADSTPASFGDGDFGGSGGTGSW